MTDVGRLRRSSPARRVSLWLRPEVSRCWAAGLPEQGRERASSGRGSLLRVDSPLGPALVRRYRRGGALRACLPDRFLSARRALAELEAAELLEPLGLAPPVLGLEIRGGLWKSLRIAVLEVDGARDLLAAARDRPALLGAPELGRAVGRTLRGMFEAGACHPDLNVANLLVSPGPRVHVIDFDGARLLDGPVPPEERERELLRLCRSLDKWAATRRTPGTVRAACLRELLDPGGFRRLTDRGREQDRRRRRRGRTGLEAPRG